MFAAVCKKQEVWNADFMRHAIISESDFENGLLFGCRRDSLCTKLNVLVAEI